MICIDTTLHKNTATISCLDSQKLSNMVYIYMYKGKLMEKNVRFMYVYQYHLRNVTKNVFSREHILELIAIHLEISLKRLKDFTNIYPPCRVAILKMIYFSFRMSVVKNKYGLSPYILVKSNHNEKFDFSNNRPLES